MKALKEKRVSLRSLFRRSLVILSLLALVFASCGDSNPTDVTDPGDNGSNTSGTETPIVTVKTMTVLKHPGSPSYEGAEPILDGLEVMVTFSDPSIRPVLAKASDFIVYPPVAYITDTSGSTNTTPTYGDYGIQYNATHTADGKAIYDLNAYRAPIWIPVVVALDRTNTGGTTTIKNAKISGTIKEAFEDQKFKTDDIKFIGDYIAPGALPSPPPGVVWGSGTWPTDTTSGSTQTLRVSSSPEAWMISTRRVDSGTDAAFDVAQAIYLADLGSKVENPASPPNAKLDKFAVKIDKLYYVLRFEYNGGADDIQPIIADFPAAKSLQGLTTNTGDPTKAAKLRWLTHILDAKLTFKVTYYIWGSNNTTVAQEDKTRIITMYDYYKAMYTVGPLYSAAVGPVDDDQNLFPKATLPYLTWDEDEDAELLNAVLDETYSTLALRLYYYGPAIEGTAGLGTVDLTSKDYLAPNSAIVPIGKRVYTFRRIEKNGRADSSAIGDENAGPVIQLGAGIGDNARSLYLGVSTFWNLKMVYANDDGLTKDFDMAWPTFVASRVTGQKPAQISANEMEFEADEANGITDSTVAITFEGPESVDFDEQEPISFPFRLQP